MVVFLFIPQVASQSVSIIRKHIQFYRRIAVCHCSVHVFHFLPHDSPVQIGRHQFIVNKQRFGVIFFSSLEVSGFRLGHSPVGIHIGISGIDGNGGIVILHRHLEFPQVMISYPPVHIRMEVVRIQLNGLGIVFYRPFVIIQVHLGQASEKIGFREIRFNPYDVVEILYCTDVVVEINRTFPHL